MFLFTEQGWEDIAVKQDQSDENQSEMKISLPSMPSLYIISFLFRACEEVHRVGGHVLDKKILHKLASRLLEKVDFLSSFDLQRGCVLSPVWLCFIPSLSFWLQLFSGKELSLKKKE